MLTTDRIYLTSKPQGSRTSPVHLSQPSQGVLAKTFHPLEGLVLDITLPPVEITRTLRASAQPRHVNGRIGLQCVFVGIACRNIN